MMYPLNMRIGFWAAALSAAMYVVFTVCFVMIAVSGPLFVWQDLPAYVAYVAENGQIWADLARLAMLLFAFLMVVLWQVLYEVVLPERKMLARIAISFGLAFAILISVSYFLQLTTVRFYLMAGNVVGLEHVLQANPISAVSAINMLGWTFFLGSSSLFMGAAMPNGRLLDLAKAALYTNALFCFVGGISYVGQWNIVLFFSINFGMGGAVLVSTVMLAWWFRDSVSNHMVT